MSKAALAIVFNHRFEQNLPKLRAYYGSRFSEVRFLMPYAQSQDADVLPVYGSSYRFHEFIAQAWPALSEMDVDHYVFTGDDCILNPALTEATLASALGIEGDVGFIIQMLSVTHASYTWPHLEDVLREYRANEFYIQWRRELPEPEDAVARFSRHGMGTGPLRFESRFVQGGFLGSIKDARTFFRLRRKGLTELEYPLAFGYSDLVIVPKAHMAEFVHCLRVFGALGLFVESAIPTALALSCPRIVTEASSEWRSSVAWGPAAVRDLVEPLGGSMRRLAEGFAARETAKHPVKLSAFENNLP